MGRTERGDGDEPTYFAHVVEDQIGHPLGRFVIPAADQTFLLAAWRRPQSRTVDVVAERLRLKRKLERLKSQYLVGDLGLAACREQKATVAGEPAALPEEEGNPGEAIGQRLVGYLADLAGAWHVATPTERNKIARR